MSAMMFRVSLSALGVMDTQTGGMRTSELTDTSDRLYVFIHLFYLINLLRPPSAFRDKNKTMCEDYLVQQKICVWTQGNNKCAEFTVTQQCVKNTVCVCEVMT